MRVHRRYVHGCPMAPATTHRQHSPFHLAAGAVNRGYRLWLDTKTGWKPNERQRLFGLTIAIGGVCGLVAVAFHESIRAVESLTIDRAYTSAGDTWVAWVILVPAAGALVSGVMLYFVPGARGSGV